MFEKFTLWRKRTVSQEKELTGYPSIDKPWLKYYTKEAIDSSLPECTIYEYMLENNKDYPDDIAINYYGHKITYRELFENIDATSKGFATLGIAQGDIVTVALPSIPEALYCVYALNKIGAVANMIHPLAGETEILHYLNEVESTVAVLFDRTYEIIGHSIEKTHVRHAIIVSAVDSLPSGIKLLYILKHNPLKFPANLLCFSWKQFVKAGSNTMLPVVKKDPAKMAIISHTGGTTGEPKGVMCSDRSINALIWQIGCNLPHSRQEKYLVVLPPFINYSLINSMLEPLAFGFQVALIPDYKQELFGKYIKKYRPNHISSIPDYWEAILTIKHIHSVDMSCLNHIYYGGYSMSEEKEQAVNELLLSCGARNKLCKGLGSTEMMSAATVTYDDCNSLECVGIPLVKTNCKIVVPYTDEECPYNVEGEICFSGPTLMIGYYNNREETNDVVKTQADGIRWYITGDLGHINTDGVLFVSGRLKRIFPTIGSDGLGTKLFPDRIERVVNTHPAVQLCCVIGVPDKRRINYAKAVIELNDGYMPSDVLTADIKNFCRDKLPEYQIPEVIEFTSALPRTERGKVDYRALEETAKG